MTYTRYSTAKLRLRSCMKYSVVKVRRCQIRVDRTFINVHRVDPQSRWYVVTSVDTGACVTCLRFHISITLRVAFLSLFRPLSLCFDRKIPNGGVAKYIDLTLVWLPARRYASAGNSDRNVSVRLSVCPSVTRRYCVKTKKASVMISSPSGCPKTLVF